MKKCNQVTDRQAFDTEYVRAAAALLKCPAAGFTDSKIGKEITMGALLYSTASNPQPNRTVQ
jgi:hypothetical protein